MTELTDEQAIALHRLPAVRAAMVAWHANPCDPETSAMVRSILAAQPAQAAPSLAELIQICEEDFLFLEGVRPEILRLAEIAGATVPAPVQAGEPVVEVYHIQHAGMNDDSYATVRLLHRSNDQWGLRIRAKDKLYTHPAPQESWHREVTEAALVAHGARRMAGVPRPDTPSLEAIWIAVDAMLATKHEPMSLSVTSNLGWPKLERP